MTEKKSGDLLSVILIAGLVAGTIDISIALIQFYIKTGKDPAIVLKYIASAVFGKNAFAGGTAMAIYGLAFHYMIAFGWTILFFFLYPKISLLSINNILTAVLYGIFIWAMMERVIVPLTKASQQPFDISKAISSILILSVAIGFPLSIFAKRYYARR